jgi:hypothetical protein
MNRLKNRLLTCVVIGFALALCACGAEDALNAAVNNANESALCQTPDGACALATLEKCQAAGGIVLLAEACPAPGSSASEGPAPDTTQVPDPEVSSSSVAKADPDTTQVPTPEASSSSAAKADPDPKGSSSSRALQASSSSVALNPPSSSSIAVGSGSYSLWELGDGRGSLGLGVLNGGFYPYSDATGTDGGTSTVTFADGTNLPDIISSPTEDVMGPLLLEKGGQIIFTTTTAYVYSYAGVGFDWVDPTAVVDPQTALPGGFSVCYTSEKDMFIVLNVTPFDVYEHNDFRVTLPKASAPTHKVFNWSQFKQDKGWGIYDEGGVANMLANYSTGIEFKFEGGGAAATNKFRLGGLGTLTDAGASHCAAILGGN